jgi:hypothetical protein
MQVAVLNRGLLWAVVSASVCVSSAAVQAADCACPPVPSCVAPAWCGPSCAAPNYGCGPTNSCVAQGSGCQCRNNDDGCDRCCKSKKCCEKQPRIQININRIRMRPCCYDAPYAVVSQSMPAVITNQSAVMPFVLQAAAFQPQQQNATANQSTAADSANKDLEKKVDQLRGDVDELADATRRLTVVLGKIDEKLTSLESKVTALKTDNNLK